MNMDVLGFFDRMLKWLVPRQTIRTPPEISAALLLKIQAALKALPIEQPAEERLKGKQFHVLCIRVTDVAIQAWIHTVKQSSTRECVEQDPKLAFQIPSTDAVLNESVMTAEQLLRSINTRRIGEGCGKFMLCRERFDNEN